MLILSYSLRWNHTVFYSYSYTDYIQNLIYKLFWKFPSSLFFFSVFLVFCNTGFDHFYK